MVYARHPSLHTCDREWKHGRLGDDLLVTDTASSAHGSETFVCPDTKETALVIMTIPTMAPRQE